MSEGRVPLADLWPESWATAAEIKAHCIEHRLDVIEAGAGRVRDAQRAAVTSAVRHLIEEARKAIRRGESEPQNSGKRPRRRRSRLDRWRGTSVEFAFRSLHSAEVFLVDLLPEHEVDASVPSVIARTRVVLDREDPRRAGTEELARMRAGCARRAALKVGMRVSYDAADDLHGQARNFRNALLLTAGLLTAFTLAFLVFVYLNPEKAPFCFTPTDTSGTITTVCPAGGTAPAAGDGLAVVSFGVLGGTLAAAFAMRKIRGTLVPYDIPMALAILKVPSGGLVAAAGILLLGGSIVPGLSALDSQPQILAYALVLGYAQQAATRLIDQRAQSLLARVPIKTSNSTKVDHGRAARHHRMSTATQN